MNAVSGKATVNGTFMDFDYIFSKLDGDAGTSCRAGGGIDRGALKAMKMGSHDILFELISHTNPLIESKSVEYVSQYIDKPDVLFYVFMKYSRTSFHAKALNLKPSKVDWQHVSEQLNNFAAKQSENGMQLHSCFFNAKGGVVSEKYGLDQNYDLSDYEGVLHLGVAAEPLVAVA